MLDGAGWVVEAHILPEIMNLRRPVSTVRSMSTRLVNHHST
jgi:hypothetical protein